MRNAIVARGVDDRTNIAGPGAEVFFELDEPVVVPNHLFLIYFLETCTEPTRVMD